MVVLLVATCTLGTASSSTAEDPSWTVMVYMANDTTTPLPSEDNLNAMEAAPQAPGTNIIVLLDEAGDGDSTILKIRHDSNADQTPIISETVEDDGEVIDSSGEVNTGAASALSDFLVFATAHWPADRYVLILWGHGAGWDGVCLDRFDLLDLVELKTALNDTVSALGRPIDVVAVDACVEATVETLYQLRTCADYFVAAETNVPYQGLPYNQILTALAEDPDQTPAGLGARIVDEFIAWSSVTSQDSATLAVFDLAKVGAFVDALDKLAGQGLKYDNIFHSTIREAMASAEYYETEWTFDVGDFLVAVSSSDVPLEMKALSAEAFAVYSDMVVHSSKFNHPDPLNGIGVVNASGAVVYAPSNSPFDTRYQNLDIASTRWDEFSSQARLIGYTSENGEDPQVTYSDANADGRSDGAILMWTEPHDWAVAWVFRHSPHGMTLVDIWVSDTGVITISGVAGELTIAASSMVNGSAVSYTLVGLTLYGEATIEVRLYLDGASVSEGYDVRVVSEDLIDYAGFSAGTFFVNLAVPTQVDVGELVTVEVLDDAGQVVWRELVFVPEGEGTLDARMLTQERTITTDSNVLLLFSVLPGLFVLAYTAMLYMDLRKKDRKD